MTIVDPYAGNTLYPQGSVFEVQDTPEYRRVLDLPRRDWEERVKHNDLWSRMTTAFRMPGGTQELQLIQAAALADAHDMRGLLAPIGVGEGKTHISALLPVVIQQVQRPVLLIPASLIEKTWIEFAVGRERNGVREDPIHQHWLCHPSFMTRKRFDESVISYQKLGRTAGSEMLQALRPDLIIADEVHFLRNRQASCTKRVERFMTANPNTMFCGMSGSITKRSIMDYWHLLYWALRHNMPLPRIQAEAEKWGEALDERKTDAVSRRGPGVILNFCTADERAEAEPKRTAPLGRTQQMPVFQYREKLIAARQGYQRRLRETPGVICSTGKSLDCSLVIRRLPFSPVPEVEDHLERLREDWVTPNGDLLTMPTEVWRYAREIATGFFYKWVPPPPEDWMRARGTWNWVVRDILSPEGDRYHEYLHLNLDSPMQVAQAVTGYTRETVDHEATDRATAAALGFPYESFPPEFDFDAARSGLGRDDLPIYRTAHHPPAITDPHIVAAYKAWAAIRKSFKINTVAQWLDDSLLKYCVGWMEKNGPGIVWTEHRAFGERLAAMLGTGFCSKKGEDAEGRAIEDYAGASVVASFRANKEGRNLQAWHKSLLVTFSPTGALVEQTLGRTHRMGQPEDTVYYDWIAACVEQDDGFNQMLADARYIQQSTGQLQKVLYADHI